MMPCSPTTNVSLPSYYVLTQLYAALSIAVMTLPAPGEQLPEPPHNEFGEAIEAISLLDRGRQNYFDACAEFAQDQKPATFGDVTTSLEDYADAFDLTLHTLTTEGSLEEYGRTLGHLHIHQDNNRVQYLNALLGRDFLEAAILDLEGVLDDDDAAIPYTTEEIGSLKKQILIQIGELFKDGLIEDTNRFALEVSGSDHAKKLDRKGTILKHALDIGKITVGTALGIWAARFLREG